MNMLLYNNQLCFSFQLFVHILDIYQAIKQVLECYCLFYQFYILHDLESIFAENTILSADTNKQHNKKPKKNISTNTENKKPPKKKKNSMKIDMPSLRSPHSYLMN